MKNFAALFGSALCALALAGNTGSAVAAAGDANAPALAGKELPDLTVSSLPAAPYTLLPTCAPGLNAIIFHIVVRNIGVAAAAPIANVHAVWVEDIAKPAWAGGAPIPAAIAPKTDLLVDVKLSALSPPSTMWGPHTFKVTVNGPKFIAESSYANNQMTIPVVIPKGFCAPSTPVSIASNPSTVITPAPSPKPTHTPFNPGVAMAPALPHPTPFPPPINLSQAFTKDVCQAHGGSAGSFACYIGLPAGKIALVWDYPSGPVDGYNVYRADLAPPGPTSVHALSVPKPIASQSDPSWKFVVLDAQKAGSCFAVTAYHGGDESARSVRLCIGNGGVPKQISLDPDLMGSMIADYTYRPDTDLTPQDNQHPTPRDLYVLEVGHAHSPELYNNDHTQVSQWLNDLFRGYVHFNTGFLTGGHIAQARLHLQVASSVGATGGQTCLVYYDASSHRWNPPSGWLDSGSNGGSNIQGPDIRLDVTPIVQTWADNPASNNGIVLNGDTISPIYKMVLLSSTCTTTFSSATLEVTYY